MNKILLIVEGEKTEKTFFTHYSSLRSDHNLFIVPFKQNIKNLYHLCKSYIIDDIKPNNIIDILANSNIPNEDKKLLDDKFTDIYLIFDFDIQNKENLKINDYLGLINELSSFFNDSTTIGQLLINYPSTESFLHSFDLKNKNEAIDVKYPSDIECNKKYKEYINSNGFFKNISKFNIDDFINLGKLSLARGNYIVNGVKEYPNKHQYEYDLTTTNIFYNQAKRILEDESMLVINTSIYIDVDLFGRTTYFIKDK